MKLNWYHLDLFCGMYSRPFLESHMDRIAEMGYNGILLEIADRVHYSKVPDFGAEDAFAPDELKSFCNGIRSRGMTVVPLLQHLGHLNHLLKHPAYQELREVPELTYSICPLHPKTRPTLNAILDETLTMVGEAPFLHLGGDESHHLGSCPKCAEYVSRHSKSALYAHFYTPICEDILSRDMRPILWHDMVCTYPEQLDMVPKGTVFVDWNYTRASSKEKECIAWHHAVRRLTQSNFEDFEPQGWREAFRPYALNDDGTVNPYYPADFLMDKGYDVILASACRGGWESYCFPDNRVHLVNLTDTARKATEKDVLGQCVTDWSIRQSTPGTRMLGIATGAWALTDNLGIEECAGRFAKVFCGLPASAGENLLRLSDILSDSPPFSFPDRYDFGFFRPANHVEDAQKLDKEEELRKLPALRKGYEQARADLKALHKDTTGPGRRWLEEWLFAAHSLLHRTDMAKVILATQPTGGKEEIDDRGLQGGLHQLEQIAGGVFSHTYSRSSLDLQSIVRFRGDRNFLENSK